MNFALEELMEEEWRQFKEENDKCQKKIQAQSWGSSEKEAQKKLPRKDDIWRALIIDPFGSEWGKSIQAKQRAKGGGGAKSKLEKHRCACLEFNYRQGRIVEKKWFGAGVHQSWMSFQAN